MQGLSQIGGHWRESLWRLLSGWLLKDESVVLRVGHWCLRLHETRVRACVRYYVHVSDSEERVFSNTQSSFFQYQICPSSGRTSIIRALWCTQRLRRAHRLWPPHQLIPHNMLPIVLSSFQISLSFSMCHTISLR